MTEVDLAVGIRGTIVQMIFRRTFSRFSNTLIYADFLPEFEPFCLVLRQIRLHGEAGFRQIQRVFQFRGHARSLSTPHTKKAGNFIIGDGFPHITISVVLSSFARI